MAAFKDYEHFDALGLAELVKQGKVAPDELLEAAIERVEARNAAVNAVTMKLYDYGRQAIVDGLPDGPFKGVPFLLKDLTAQVAGIKMTRGSKFFADTPPPTMDSEHVKRLKAAGLVIFGRTNTCELGLSLTCEPQLHGPPRAHGTPRASPAAPRAERPRRWARAWYPSPTPPMASAPSARLPPAVAPSVSSPRAAATPWRPT